MATHYASTSTIKSTNTSSNVSLALKKTAVKPRVAAAAGGDARKKDKPKVHATSSSHIGPDESQPPSQFSSTATIATAKKSRMAKSLAGLASSSILTRDKAAKAAPTSRVNGGGKKGAVGGGEAVQRPRSGLAKAVSESVLRPTSASLLKQKEKVVFLPFPGADSAEDAADDWAHRDSRNDDHNEKTDESSEGFQEDNNRKLDQYPATPLQLSIYNRVCPDIDDSSQRCSFESNAFFISQCFKVTNGSIDLPLLGRVINKITNSYKVLTTRFYQNSKIVDADVQAFIDHLPANQGDDTSCKYLRIHESEDAPTTEYVSKSIRAWMAKQSQTYSINPVFTVLAFPGSADSPKSFVAPVFSRAVADALSCVMVSNEIFSLYFDAVTRPDRAAQAAVVDEYTPKEQNDDFTDFAYKHTGATSAAAAQAHSFWKATCIENVQEMIDARERADIEAQQTALLAECEHLKTTVAQLASRRTELEAGLSALRLQRRQMDADNGGSVEVYMDPVTNQVTEISKGTKAAIVKIVLGNDAADGSSVAQLLRKHDCSSEVLAKVGHLNLDAFSTLSDDDLGLMGLLSKDRRKVLALAEYCRNRIKECIQEQTKVKFALERKILKQQREYDMCVSNLKAAQNSLEVSDDMAIRLGNILNPPTFENKIPVLSLEPKSAAKHWSEDYNLIWGFLPFEVDEQVVRSLRHFQESCAISDHQHKKNQSRKRGSDNESSSDGDYYDSTEISDIKPQDSKACCLAAFAVTLKHIVGVEKFLVGVQESFRTNGVLVGPLSDMVPIKFDFSVKDCSFNTVLSNTRKALSKCAQYASTLAFIDVAAKLSVDAEFPIQFEYFPEKVTLSWRHAGLSTRDLLSMKVFSAHEAKGENSIIDIERLWTVDERSRPCEFKLVIVEDAEEIVGAVQYKRDLYDDDKVQKWIAKFITTLEGIEFGPKKVTISQLISRYYSSVLLHSDDGLSKHAGGGGGGAAGSRRSLESLRTLPGSDATSLFNILPSSSGGLHGRSHDHRDTASAGRRKDPVPRQRSDNFCRHPTLIERTVNDKGRDGVFRGTLTALRMIRQRDGVAGLYRGLSPNFAASTLSWAFYFTCYDSIKAYFKTHVSPDAPLTPVHHLAASAVTGVLTCLLTNPLWIMKIRMCADRAGDPNAYPSLAVGLRRLYAEEGVRGLYRGIVPALMGVSQKSVQFVVYEEMKHWRTRVRERKHAIAPASASASVAIAEKPTGSNGAAATDLTTADYVAIATVAKGVAMGVTYPYQVVRARIQVRTRMLALPAANGILTFLRCRTNEEKALGYTTAR
ncbi:hypothetical protein HDU83_009501 [Entophlyctis luteolus]|nr:hypothetical protein HDU83_009501 [Entophlyctis luteolus]